MPKHCYLRQGLVHTNVKPKAGSNGLLLVKARTGLCPVPVKQAE